MSESVERKAFYRTHSRCDISQVARYFEVSFIHKRKKGANDLGCNKLPLQIGFPFPVLSF